MGRKGRGRVVKGVSRGSGRGMGREARRDAQPAKANLGVYIRKKK
jgi:hypothetical protein